MRKLESDPIIDTMKDSYCCLSCHTLADPFVGCACNQEKLFADLATINREATQVKVICLSDIVVECDHCGEVVPINEAHKTEWKEFNAHWYYCTRCETGVFGNHSVLDMKE